MWCVLSCRHVAILLAYGGGAYGVFSSVVMLKLIFLLRTVFVEDMITRVEIASLLKSNIFADHPIMKFNTIVDYPAIKFNTFADYPDIEINTFAGHPNIKFNTFVDYPTMKFNTCVDHLAIKVCSHLSWC